MKDFDEFRRYLAKHDFSDQLEKMRLDAVESIENDPEIQPEDRIAVYLGTNSMDTTMLILREYHTWLMSQLEAD